MDKFDIIFFGFIFGGLALYIIAGVIRMAVDPEYERKVKDEAARQRAEKRRKRKYYYSWTDEDDATDMYGNPLHPDRYRRTKEKEWKEWLRMQD